jgi:hypothetical protein
MINVLFLYKNTNYFYNFILIDLSILTIDCVLIDTCMVSSYKLMFYVKHPIHNMMEEAIYWLLYSFVHDKKTENIHDK